MDWSKALLGMLILAISMSSCADVPVDEGEGQLLYQLQDGSDHAGHGDTDDCSIFCNCECCGLSITGIAQSHIGLMALINQRNQYSSEKYFPAHSFDIWQPPKS